MADIELVIKINKDIAQGIIDGENDAPRNIVQAFQATIADAIKNGTPLPKGHGRLIDCKRVAEVFRRNVAWYAGLKQLFEIAPTIIEADKESEGE